MIRYDHTAIHLSAIKPFKRNKTHSKIMLSVKQLCEQTPETCTHNVFQTACHPVNTQFWLLIN